MDHWINIIATTLSDGSKVYDVDLPTRLHAVTFADAQMLAKTIVRAIADHTNDAAGIHWEEYA